jgi:hypothetical protein
MTLTHPTRRPRHLRRLVVAVGACTALAVVAATPAGADTSAATATALRLAGTPIPETSTATNDGTQPTVVSGGGDPSALPSNPVLGAGALGQVAAAGSDGTSAACAGLIAPSSEITIAPNGACDPGTTSSGVTLNLASLLTLNAGSITAECTASSTGEPTGRARLANAAVTLGGLPLLTLDADPDPNSVVGLAGILDVTLNRQEVGDDGSITVTALSVTVVGQGLIEVGQVTCGPNEITGAIPIVPAAGLPIAGLVLAGAGATLLVHRRRATRFAAA